MKKTNQALEEENLALRENLKRKAEETNSYEKVWKKQKE
jgi:IS1 family transposase